jgi:putative heme transporter
MASAHNEETRTMSTPASQQDGAGPRAGPADSRRRFSATITPRSIWLGAALAVAILVGILLVTRALSTLILLMLAIILGEAIRPLVVRLERFRIPRPLAVLLIYVVALGLLGALLWVLLNPFINEVSSLAQHAPQYITQLQRWVAQMQKQLNAQTGLTQALNSLSKSLASALQQSVPALLAVPVNLVSGVLGAFISLVVILTMTLFWLMSSQSLKPFVVGLFPPHEQERTSAVIGEIGKSFGGYVRGTLISMVLIGLLTGLGLGLLGVPYAVLLGGVAGLTELLPYLGPWISGTIAVIVALVAVNPLKAVEVILLFLLIQELEGNLVQPLVMSRAVRVDPLLVIASVLIGIDLLGVVGAILGVPIAAAAQVLVVRVLAPAIRRNWGKPEALEVTVEAAPSAAPAPSPAPAEP